MARPSAPLSLNSGSAVGASVDRCWLVTADADPADLKAIGPDLTRTSSPVYADDTYIGPSFGGTGYCQNTETGTIMTSIGFRTGCIFTRSSTKTAGTGIEVLFSLAEDSETINAGAWYYYLGIDDGSSGLTGSAAGKIIAVWRTARYGSVVGRVGPTLAANTAYFVTHGLNTWSDALYVNDVEYSGGGMGGGSWYGSGKYVNLGCLDGYNTTASKIIAADTKICTAWFDANGMSAVTDVQAKTWSADGWDMFTSGAASGVPKTSRQTLLGVA